MEQPRHRDAATGAGGPGGAWNGICGHRPSPATTPGPAGDDGDESGERDPPVPNPGSVPDPGGVASPGSVPNPGSVPRPGGVAGPGSVPRPGGVAGPGSVPSPEGAPSPGRVPNPGSVPNPGGIASPGRVPNPRSVPSPEGVPSPGSVPSPGGVANPGSVPSPGGVANPGSVPSPERVPSPGGRCGCRGPPAAPPSPSRAIACGLGCRHRGIPEGDNTTTTNNTRRTRRRARQQHEEDQGATGKGYRGSLRVARAGVALCLRLLGALLAMLLLLLLLLLGGLRFFLRGASAGLRRCQELLREWLQRPRSPAGVPSGGEEEVTRLVAMAEVAEEELNPFLVLGVEPTASDTELRRAYRRLAVLVHPDKSRDPRAEAAFKVLRAGWERVSSPERRREYETKQLAQGELARALGAFLGRLQEEFRDAMDAMGCTRCGGRHRRFQLDRDPRSARYCAECGGWHAAEEGDLWAESSLLGLKVTYLARMDGHVYDVTEWAGCQRVAISPDSHRAPYHLSFSTRTATAAGRQRVPPKGSPPTPADLQDFLARVFQGNSGPGEFGGGFPTPPGAAGPPQGPPRAEGVPPRGDTKHKRRKKGRRPLPR